MWNNVEINNTATEVTIHSTIRIFLAIVFLLRCFLNRDLKQSSLYTAIPVPEVSNFHVYTAFAIQKTEQAFSPKILAIGVWKAIETDAMIETMAIVDIWVIWNSEM